jgi:hypothetical protein
MFLSCLFCWGWEDFGESGGLTGFSIVPDKSASRKSVGDSMNGPGLKRSCKLCLVQGLKAPAPSEHAGRDLSGIACCSGAEANCGSLRYGGKCAASGRDDKFWGAKAASRKSVGDSMNSPGLKPSCKLCLIQGPEEGAEKVAHQTKSYLSG